MVIATMANKDLQTETLLIDKADVDRLKKNLSVARQDLAEARDEVVGLNVQVVLLQTDLNCMAERCEIYENNVLCRTILWLDLRIKRLLTYIRRRFEAWVDRKWGTDYEQIH